MIEKVSYEIQGSDVIVTIPRRYGERDGDAVHHDRSRHRPHGIGHAATRQVKARAELHHVNGLTQDGMISHAPYLVMDTETTGVPQDWTAPISDLANWPRIVQLAWALLDDAERVLERGA